MTPSHAVKGGVRYRYYIWRASTQSAAGSAATIVRLTAPDIEEAVLKALADTAESAPATFGVTGERPMADDLVARRSNSVRTLAERVNVRPGAIKIERVENVADDNRAKTIVVVCSKPSTRVQREVILPAKGQCEDPRAISSDTRSRLLSTIAIARRWQDDLAAGRVESFEALAAREGRSTRSVTMLLSLAFLALDSSKRSSTSACREASASPT